MASRVDGIVERLIASHEPSVEYKALVNILRDDPDSKKLRNCDQKSDRHNASDNFSQSEDLMVESLIILTGNGNALTGSSLT